MELDFGKFREGKSDFERSTKRNFQILKFLRPQFEAFLGGLEKFNFLSR